MDEPDEHTVGEGAELSAGPDSDERIAERRDAEHATDQDLPDDQSDAMHGRG